MTAYVTKSLQEKFIKINFWLDSNICINVVMFYIFSLIIIILLCIMLININFSEYYILEYLTLSISCDLPCLLFVVRS